MNSMEKKRTYRAARIRRPREEQIYLTAFPEVRLRAINQLRIDDLGWSRDETLETLMRLRSFEEDWEAPGMEDYDEL